MNTNSFAPSPFTEAPSDEALMAALANARSEPALELLYTRYHGLIRHVISHILHDDGEADDIIQDVLIQVWERASTYSPDKGQLRSWLAVLARRRALDRLRQRYAYNRATTAFQEREQPDNLTQGKRLVDDEVEGNDLRSFLCEKMKLLPQPQAEVVRMAFLEGLSQRKIAEQLGLPLGTIKTRIELGLARLAKSLQGVGKELLPDMRGKLKAA